MPDHPTSNPAQFIQGCAVLHARDVRAIAGFDSYHAEVVACGANVEVEPSNTSYGLREFTVRAPSGLAIVFGQDID